MESVLTLATSRGELLVGFLSPREYAENVNDLFRSYRAKNNSIASNSLAIAAFPFLTFQRLNVSQKGICAHQIQMLKD
jgi:hypothetical protein